MRLAIASRAGCRKIYYGIESVSSDVLQAVNKKISVEKTVQAIQLTQKYGIDTLGFFMIGNPSDTKESVLSAIDFAKAIKLDYIQVCRVIAKPNTELDDLLKEKYGRDFWREYILNEKGLKRLPVPWTSLSEEEIDTLTRKFYNDFYFRFRILKKRTGRIQSINELVRYAVVCAKWVFCNSKDV